MAELIGPVRSLDLNLVLFLGAGFSKPFGLPTMTGFFDHALGDGSPLDGQERSLITDLRRQVRKTTSMLDADEGNLEDLLSVCLFSDEGWPGAVSPALLRCLWKVYRSLDPGICEPLFESALKKLVGFDQIDSHHHTVITTNYDVVAEYGFWRIRRPLGLPCEWQPTADAKKEHLLHDPMGSTRVICKLHGSINWFLGQGGDSADLLQVDGRIKHDVELSPEGRASLSVPHVSHKKCPSPERAPLIVPPTLYKGFYPACFNPIWKAARDALRKADRLVFVGYSFPPSDTHLKYFLACSLAENVSFKSIDILDLEASQICDRLRLPSAGFGSAFRQKLRAFDGRWEENSQYNILER